jgi:hypothetical protein
MPALTLSTTIVNKAPIKSAVKPAPVASAPKPETMPQIHLQDIAKMGKSQAPAEEPLGQYASKLDEELNAFKRKP